MQVNLHKETNYTTWSSGPKSFVYELTVFAVVLTDPWKHAIKEKKTFDTPEAEERDWKVMGVF